MLYSCETAIKESWFVKARTNKTWKVDISYDPRNMNNIYIHTKSDSLFESCYLLEHQERYRDKILEEVNDLLKREKENYKNQDIFLCFKEINLFDSIGSIVDEAVKNANSNQSKNLSNAQKTKSIRENRKFEKTSTQ